MEQNRLSHSLGDGSNGQRFIIAWMSWGLRFAPGATELRHAAIDRAEALMNDFLVLQVNRDGTHVIA